MTSTAEPSPSVPAPDPQHPGLGVDPPCPVLALLPDGRLLRLSEEARRLLPGPDDAPAVRAVRERLAGDPGAAPLWIGDRCFDLRRTPGGPDGAGLWWLFDRTERHRAESELLAELHEERARSETLGALHNALLSTLNLDRCRELTVRLAAEHLAEAAVLIGPPEGRRMPLTYAYRGGPVTRSAERVDVTQVPGLVEALQSYPPVPAHWTDPGELPAWVFPPGFGGRVGSVVVKALPGHGVPAGAMVLLRTGTAPAFDRGEAVFARLFAARAGAALSTARLYAEQTALTATLMRDLLPPVVHAVHGVEYAGSYRASADHEQIGGDFYDVHAGAGPDEETLVVLGDVAGKGLEAAVLTGKIRNTLQALLPLAGDHERVLSLLNGALLSSRSTRFATLVLVSVHRPADGTGEVGLRLSSAGHPPPLIVRADGTVEEADTRGTLVGALPDVQVHSAHVTLAPGETCLLYTDGLIEARGGPLGDEFFGERRLKRALADCARMPAEAVVEHVTMLATHWVGEGPHDDMAVLAITAPRPGAPLPDDRLRSLS